MKLYKLLESKKKRIKHLWKTKEYALFSDKLDLLLKFPQVNKQLLETSDDFKIIQANILIQALLNKTQIEKRAKKYLTLNEEEKKDAESKIADLRRRVQSGAVRMSVPATACTVSTNTGTGAVETRAELDPKDADDFIAIAADGDAAIRELNLCIDKHNSLK